LLAAGLVVPIRLCIPDFEVMGFFTEMFVRPKRLDYQNFCTAMAVLNAMGKADRADMGIKPADFPRIARR
jgi:hypothetical protein